MTKTRPPTLNLPSAAQAALVAGARDREPVRGLTHGFYKYPARFSPSFVRAAIETFTQPADLVLDNHVGGGTTLVEALVLGRHAIGVDISPLAEFVATVKTTIFDEAELDRLASWATQAAKAVAYAHLISLFRGPRRARLLQASRSSLALAAAKSDRARCR